MNRNDFGQRPGESKQYYGNVSDGRRASVIDKAKEVYDWALEKGIAKEQARVVLPEGNTKTRLYMNGTLRSWIHYIELRAANGTQKEHMDIARACAEVVAKIFPLANNLIQTEE